MTRHHQTILFVSTMVGISGILWFGTYRRWKWLVDPPVDYWFFYSQSAIKKLLGVRAVVIFDYSVAIAIFAISALGLISLITGAPPSSLKVPIP
jgi:fatty acid desaturase